jgi:hypothetical protein
VRRLVDEEVKTTFSEIELIPDADDSILPWKLMRISAKAALPVELFLMLTIASSRENWYYEKQKQFFFVIGLICLHILIMLCD